MFPRLVLAALLALCVCCRTKKYTGNSVCELLKPQDIEAIYGEPFQPGQRTLLDDENDEYIGSNCSFDSVARAPDAPKQAKFRVFIEVIYVEPEEASIAKIRRRWETSTYNNTPFYRNVHDIPGFGDAIGARDYNGGFEIVSILKPSTKMDVTVMNVVEGEAEDRAKSVAQKMINKLAAEKAAPVH
jgi:hypothetical protein